ncbi:MAG: hypothetical protein L3J56_00710 [Bacteroidales bacterium]|nr:hypothetical protein [Bacteroidales bacterium]
MTNKNIMDITETIEKKKNVPIELNSSENIKENNNTQIIPEKEDSKSFDDCPKILCALRYPQPKESEYQNINFFDDDDDL